MPLRAWLWVPLIAVAISAGMAATAVHDGLSRPAALTAVSSAAAAALAVVAFIRANRATADWVKGASGVARELAEGRLGARVPGTHIGDLAVLGRHMNDMAQAIEESTTNLRRQAYHDLLTGLPNRAHFMVRAREALRAARRGSVSVLFMDLDRFKVLNDTLGHGAGDALLQLVAERLQETAGHLGIVARLGGDEFTMLVFDPRAGALAEQLAARVVERMRAPFEVSGHQVFVTASVGIATNDRGLESVSELMRKADVALYRAKGSGKARYAVFDATLDELSVEQLHLDAELRSAIGRGPLRLHYQPEYDLRNGRMLGMEALVRWEHPHRGILAPSEFIALAEETGEIWRIGAWVVENACRQVMALRLGEPAVADLVLAVNLSAPEFREERLAQDIRAVLERTGMPAVRLKLELTESVVMEDIQATLHSFEQLRRVGVQLAIDDFGTGYSSLSYLQNLPVDTLKVDQSFVRRVGTAPRSDAILAAIVELGRALGLHVVGEGVETPAQLRFLRGLQCHAAQGFLLAPPVPAAEIPRLLRSPDGSRAAAPGARRAS